MTGVQQCARKAISKKLRFEVFKRDKFTCQYCGRIAPEVILNADHIKPVADGGPTTLLNLITSCAGCNNGKRDRSLADSTVLQKQHAELAQLEERRQQIEMMAQWRAELEDLDGMALRLTEDVLAKAIGSPDWINDSDRRRLREYIARHGWESVVRAVSSSCSSYLKRGSDGIPTAESVDQAIDMIPRVMSMQRRSVGQPHLQRMLYARGIVRNRLGCGKSYDREILSTIQTAIGLGADVEDIVHACCEITSYSDFVDSLDSLCKAVDA